MTELDVIADDVTGACDVGAELASAGLRVRVAVDGTARDVADDEVLVVNTQSRTVRSAEAHARVLRVARRRPVELLLKKIDTALRGHLGAELDAAIDGLGAVAAFVAPAIPAAGRVTRGGRQWFAGRRLEDTEFAADPESAGAESSVAAVIARESRRRSEVIGLATLRAGAFGERARTLMRAGADLFVVDAESDDDLASAAHAIVDLPRPLCVAGSIGITAALARALAAEGVAMPAAHDAPALRACATPALVVSGSLHSMARAQLAAACSDDRADQIALPASVTTALDPATRARVVAQATTALAAGRSVVVAAPAVSETPDATSRRALERALAEIARDVLQLHSAASLVLVGGETTYAVLRALAAAELVVHGRVAPLVATGVIANGDAAGLPIVVKGGSGGDPETLRALLDGGERRRVASA